MDRDELWRRVRAAFDAAVALDEPGVVRRLEREPPEVREEVERLLAIDSRRDSVLPEERIREEALGSLWGATLSAGQEVDGHRLVRALGSGGMGVVFEALQRDPARRVALKTVRAEFFTSALRERFRTEVELLARLEHPGIARVYATGTFDRGGESCPYYTMELVSGGRTLLEYADEEGLDLRARIELFLQACDAVDFGHRKGVLHRDLKPGNLLVDDAGRLRVIDFGLARAQGQEAADDVATRTRAGTVLGTLAYMSPEHVSGRPLAVDVRSDVWSLGSLLHELTTGRPAHDLVGIPIRDALERIEHEEPSPATGVPRELAWVLARAVANDPGRRYPTAAALAADLRRHLADEPVEAAPPSRVHRLRTWLRRHRGLVAATLAVLTALVVGLVREGRARRAAEVQADLATQTSRFLEALFLQGNDYELGDDARLADVLARAAGLVDEVRAPEVRAVLVGLVGQGFLNLDELDAAGEWLARARELGRSTLAPDSPGRLHNDVLYADFLERTGRYAEARDLALELLAAGGLARDDRSYARGILAAAATMLGDVETAERIHAEELERATRDGAPAGVRAARMHALGRARIALDRGEEATRLFEDGLTLARTAGLDAYETLFEGELGTLDLEAGRLASAEARFRRVLADYAARGERPFNRAMVALDLAQLLLVRDAPGEAREWIALASDLAVEVPGESRLEVRCLLLEAQLEAAGGDLDAAVAVADEAVRLGTRLGGADGLLAEVARGLRDDLRAAARGGVASDGGAD